ncbi:Tetratricopeptide repeat-containing protein [Flexibacter flexilis DSM 6793]|uniref:Tetratricopeptide repeat-containing protein n=1 Tax=Flexibacter flexilis DSM 6793 TaxID=927664 RepID=A0A1I1I1V2_9BACT|nr:tetratricopeptide repeat protein [Flexibacter flexilis]SFC27200.1 Tetratricopeptide repeat-containing protein [Flexibacter flexilis DSM 6793]
MNLKTGYISRKWLAAAFLASMLAVSTPTQAQRARKGDVSAANRTAAEENFVEAMKYDLLENYDKALSSLEKVLQYTPDNAAAYFKMAEIKLKKNRVPEAVADAEKALKLDDSNAYYYTLLAQIYEKQNRFADAAKIYTQLTKKYPSDIEYYYLQAGAYINDGQYKDALKVYDRLEKETGLSEEISRSRQQIYLRTNRLDDAVKEGRKLMESYPDEPLYQVSLAELLAANNKIEESEKLAKQTLVQFPDEPHAQLLLSDIYRSQGKTKEANDYLTMAFENGELEADEKIQILDMYRVRGFSTPEEKEFVLKLSRIIVSTHPNSSRALASYGDFLKLADQKKEARQQYLLSAKLDANNDNLWANIVETDLENNEFDSTAKHTEAALEYFPNNVAFWYYNGLAHLIQKNYLKAITALEQSRRLAFGNDKMLLDIYAQLGDAYHSTKDYKKSDESYDAALKIDDKNAHVLNNYSYYLSLRKDHLGKARKMGEKLVEIAPNEDTYLDTYGWVLYVDKDYTAARKYLEKAAQTSKSGVVIEHYGDVLYQLGDKEAALVQWKKAKELGTEDDARLSKKIADKKLYE